jgi:hypothetical protein
MAPALGSIQVFHQTLDTQFAERSKILLHRRKGRPKKAGFRDIIKTDNRDILWDPDSTFLERPDCS